MKTCKQIMAERLDYLMRVNPSLDTLTKLAKAAGVSYGTVRRIRVADEVDVSVSSAEAVAKAFGLTLAEFVSEAGSGLGLTADEFELLTKYRQLKDEDKREVKFFASIKSGLAAVGVKGLLD